MSTVLSLRIPDATIDRLDRFSRRLGNGMTRSRAGALLLEEAVRQTDHTGVEFRDSPVGRQAYVKGTTLAVWEVIDVARDLEMDVNATASHLAWRPESVNAATSYYSVFRAEIDEAIADNAVSFDELKARLPSLELQRVREPAG